MRKPFVVLVIALSASAPLAVGCGGDDEEPTTTGAAATTGASGLSGASGASGASGDISQVEQNLEDAGLFVEPGDPASLTVTLPDRTVEAQKKLDVSGVGLSSTAFVAEYATEEEAEQVFDQYKAEAILETVRQGTVVYSAPTKEDLDVLIGYAGGD